MWTLTPGENSPDARAMLLAELEDFVTRHRACGTMTGDATEPAPDGYMLNVSCSYGVSFLRWLAPEDAERELDS